MRRRRLYCSWCRVEFEIVLEPGHKELDDRSFAHCFSKSIAWLKQIDECPICGHELEEIPVDDSNSATEIKDPCPLRLGDLGMHIKNLEEQCS